MVNYLKQYLQNRNAQPVPQSEPLPGQIPNSAGGYSYPVDDWKRLDRFLILGSEGGTYYIREQALTEENANAVKQCLALDGVRVVERIVAISVAGRAPKNDPALFALALCFALGDPETKAAARAALPKVCRIGTHLLHFGAYVNGLRGWGRGLRNAVAEWYTEQPAKDVAFQVTKYQSRDGWAHRDLLRLAHPSPPSEAHNIIFNWAIKGWESVGNDPHPLPEVQIIWAMEKARSAQKPELVRLIEQYKLQREMIPTKWLTDPDIWAAMLPNLGLTALIRNLGTLSKCGLLVESNHEMVNRVCATLTNKDALRKSRVHPLAVLTALLTYKAGHGMRGSGRWSVVTKVVDALDNAFYKTFQNVEASGKRTLLALDVSGSMTIGRVGGVPGLTPRLASAAMALVTAATEQDYTILGFSDKLVPVNISPRQRLDDVTNTINAITMGGTDCALPMLWAINHKALIDTFIVYTDSETWFGSIHPAEALRKYREQSGIAARLIVVGMVSNGFTIADPQDAGMLDMVGFDSAAPAIMSDFSAGRI